MASRAELIMAQVRGELGQLYRKKAPTTGEGILEDLTGAALGYNTATEIMYALEPGVQKIKDRRYKKGKKGLMDKYSGITTEESDELLGDEVMDMDPLETISGPIQERTPYSPPLDKPVRPDDPKPIITKQQSRYVSPSEVPDDLPLSYNDLPLESEVEKNLEAATGDLYLRGTIDTNFSNVGTFETTFSDSTGVKFHNVDLNKINNQDGPLILNRAAFGASQFIAGAPTNTIASDANTIQNQNYLNYLLGTTTPPLSQPVRPEMGLPIQDEEERPLGNLFPQAIPGEITIKSS